MDDKITIFLAIDDDKLLNEIQPLINIDKFKIESYHSEVECIEHLDLKPEYLIIDYHLNNNSSQKEKNSVSVIESIKKKKLGTKIFMFSDRGSAKIYLNMIENK